MKTLTSAIATALVLAAAPALADKPAGKPGAIVSTALGCDALDPTGAVFTDPTAILHTVVTPSGNVNTVCHGHLLPDTPFPTSAVVFNDDSGTGFVCLSAWEETITPEGSFVLTCHFKANGKGG